MKANAFDTGISDHHKMISNIIKHHFTRESPLKTSYYRDFRKLDIDYVSSELFRQLHSTFCSVKENEGCKELYELLKYNFIAVLLLLLLFVFLCVFVLNDLLPYSDCEAFSVNGYFFL